MNSYQDEVLILQVNNWENDNKKAICFSRGHGKIVFIAYGARYPKSREGRLIQPFACLHAEFYPGHSVEKLKSCELAAPMPRLDLNRLAYGFLMAESTDLLTERGEASEGLYILLKQALSLLAARNPRLAALAYLIQLLDYCGIGPVYEVCVSCGRQAVGGGWFCEEQGGFLCEACHSGRGRTEALLPFPEETRKLWQQLRMLNFGSPGNFTVKGGVLMELERILHRYLVYQAEHPLKSLDFIRQIF